MEKKTKFKRRMFAVAAIVGMGMTMTQIAFGKKVLMQKMEGLTMCFQLIMDIISCVVVIYIFGMVMLQNRLCHCVVVLIAVIQQRIALR